MKRACKALSLLLSVVLVLGLVFAHPMQAKAANISFSLSISCADGMDVPGHYGVSYECLGADQNSIDVGHAPMVSLEGLNDGTEVSESYLETSDAIAYIKISVTNAGKDVYYNGSKDNTWASGKVIPVDEIATSYVFQLQDSQGGGQGGGSGPQSPENPVGISIELNAPAGLLDTQGHNFWVDGYPVEDGKVQVDSTKTTHIMSFQVAFGSSVDKVIVNGTEYVPTDAEGGQISVTVPHASAYDIALTAGVSDDVTIAWAYDLEEAIAYFGGADAYIANGTVSVLKIEHDGAVVYSAGDELPFGSSVDETGGYLQVKTGDIITVQLVPKYGYQVVGARINGEVDLTAGTAQSTFSFEMPATNVHFQGVFNSTADIVANSASAVSGATFDGSNVATSGGTAKMTIADATPASTASVSGVDTTKSVQAVDITMDQLFYKNIGSNVWSTNKTELSSPAEVSLTVNQAADGYTVLRTHGEAVEEIPASYDPATNKITFASNKYSTYTLVPLKKGNNTYVPETKSESKGEEAKKPVVVEEVIKDIKQVTADKTALALQTEQLIPTTTFNFSSVKTFKGFVTSVEKASQKTLQADSKAKVVSIYTNKPFCFNRNILEAMRKTNQTFVYYFMYKNHLYSVTVPAGTDPSKVLEKNGCAGPLYIGKVLGTTVLIK